jgi:hypothetical protein
MKKWPEKFPVVVAMVPPDSYIIAVSKTEGYTADLGGERPCRWPVTLLDSIYGHLGGDEYVELDDYNYDLIPQIEKLKLVGT